MIEVVETPKAGCEKIVAIFDEAIASIETAQETEIADAIQAIHAKYEERLENYKTDRTHYVDRVEVEKPDPVVEEQVIGEEQVPTDENNCCEEENGDGQVDF